MDLVRKRKEIEANLDRLQDYGQSSDRQARVFYRDLLERGICFVAYRRHGWRCFGPSRFIGYVNNDLRRHQANHSKGGRATNRAIKRVLGYPPGQDAMLEREYLQECARAGLRPGSTGPFRTKRKFWSEPVA